MERGYYELYKYYSSVREKQLRDNFSLSSKGRMVASLGCAKCCLITVKLSMIRFCGVANP